MPVKSSINLNHVEVPTIGELSEEQRAAYRAIVEDFHDLSDHSVDGLIGEGLSPTHANSAAAHAAINAAARSACIVALLEGRVPNEEWFLKNCADALARYVEQVDGD